MLDAHATVFLHADVAACVEPLRHQWDPAMADAIAAHVTVTYPAEVPCASILRERLAAAAGCVSPFHLRLGEVRCFGPPEDGVYVQVVDEDGGWLALREAVGVTGVRLVVEPHVTIVHPRTSARGADAWTALQGTVLDVGVTVDQAALTALEGRAWRTVATFDLTGPVPGPSRASFRKGSSMSGS